MPTLEGIGSIIAIILAILGPIFGFLFKRLLDNLERDMERLEAEIKEGRTVCAGRHDILPATYVPRTEITEITRGLRESAELQRRQIESLHKKVDSLITMVKNGHSHD